MDFRSRIFLKVLFALLLIPTLIWGYSKAVFRVAQSSEDSAIDGPLDSDATSKGKNEAPGQASAVPSISSGENGIVNSPITVQTKQPIDSEVAKSTDNSEDPIKAGNTASKEKAPDRVKSETEPELDAETYNQMRVKKPSIPNRFGTVIGQERSRNQSSDKTSVPMLGLLGVPTLVFSLLFFVMWGIISGRIQRIMF